MNLEVKAAVSIPNPAHEVFDAIVNKDKIINYFVREASASLVEGIEVTWDFGLYGKGNVLVTAVDDNRRVAFEWDNKKTEITLEPADDGFSTSVKIRETGWTEIDQKSIDDALDRTQGWTDMLLCLKAYLQFGVDLREPARVTEKVM